PLERELGREPELAEPPPPHRAQRDHQERRGDEQGQAHEDRVTEDRPRLPEPPAVGAGERPHPRPPSPRADRMEGARKPPRPAPMIPAMALARDQGGGMGTAICL